MADLSRRSLLRAFLAAPVAVRLAPFVRPAPGLFSALTAAGYEFVVFMPEEWEELRRWRRRNLLLPDPPLLVSPSVHAALTEGKPLPPEPTEFYEGNFFVDGNER